MSFNRYKKDIERLVTEGVQLQLSMFLEQYPEQKKEVKLNKKLPVFSDNYQTWYSEAVVCLSQLLPERLEDFRSYYNPPKTRKEINHVNYTLSDYLKGVSVTQTFSETMLAEPKSAIPAFRQQVNIVKSLERRFESSLFDIRALVQADLFDNELDAAEELNSKGFHRGAGAVAGVVLEEHLRTACEQHKITARKNSTLGTLNDFLKDNSVLDVPTWRFIQHLIDIRNMCDHKKAKDPTKEDIEELVEGVRKITKTVF